MSAASWLTLSQSQVTQTGISSVSFQLSAATAARTATIVASVATGTIAPSSIQIEQAPPVVSPTCEAVDASLNTSSFPAAGGHGQIAIKVIGTCQPPAVTADQPWVHISMPGSSLATFDVSPNTATSARSARITVISGGRAADGSPFTIRQEGVTNQGGECSYSVDRTSIDFGTAADSVTINVHASGPDCTYSAGPVSTTSEPRTWARISRTSGTGSSSVTVSVDAAAAQGRSADIPIAGFLVTVRQPATLPTSGCQCTGPACGANMQMSIDRNQFPAAGGDTTVHVLALNSCSWTLTSTTSWITFVDPAHGIGNGTVRIHIPPNTGSSRSADIRSPEATPASNGAVAHAALTQSAP